jgi:hypothetical protein
MTVILMTVILMTAFSHRLSALPLPSSILRLSDVLAAFLRSRSLAAFLRSRSLAAFLRSRSLALSLTAYRLWLIASC